MSHLTLPQRMRVAAEVLEEVSALYGYNPSYGLWNSETLIKEADVIESDVPA